MKNSSPNSCNVRTLRRFFLAGCVALCFISCPITASAQGLTQQDVEDAVYNALYEYALLVAGSETLRTIPYDGYGSPLYAWMRVTSGTNPNTASFARAWHPIFTRLDTAIPLLVSASTNRAELVQILNAVRALGAVTNQLPGIAEGVAAIDANTDSLEGFLSGTPLFQSDVLDALQGVNQELYYIRDPFESQLVPDVASILGILRNEENPVEVDVRQSGVAYGILAEILAALDGSGSGGGPSIVGVLQGLTNSLAGGDTTPVSVENFDDLAPVLSDFGEELAAYEWDVNVLNFDSSGSDWLTAFESSSLVRSNLSSVAFLAADARQSASSGSVVAASTPSSISAQNDEDRVVESNSFFSWFTSKVEEPPEMEHYETADPPSSDYDATMQPNLLPSSALAPTLYHNTRIKLAERGMIAGVRHDDIEIDIFGISGGALGSWVSKLDDIVRAAYYGFLAVASALLFWRYQTKISFVLRDAPRV